MVKIEFNLLEADFDLLMELKDEEGYSNLSGNDYARQLIEDTLYIKKQKLKKQND